MKTRLAAAVLGVAILTAGCSSGDSSKETTALPSSAKPSSAEPSESPAPAPEPTENPTPTPTEPEIPRYPAGEAVDFAGITLTINSVEVAHEIPAVDGQPFVAEAGEQLVLVKTSFVNSGDGLVDLSCGGVNDAYIQGWDSEGREMAQIFETYRLEGNPECNSQLLRGQGHDWNILYRSIDGATPVGLSIVNTNGFDSAVHLLFPGIE